MAEAGAKPPSDREDALAVLLRLREAGHVAYFAGGCVRDLLLGLPAKDYDVATDAPPNRVRELFHNTQAVGAAFGVILVRQRKSMIEVATFRTDGDYSDGRRPDSVQFTTAEEDAKRRDFTINGLFLDPVADDGRGRVIDYVGGQADLKAKVIRAIGDPAKRFEEDYLRMLRAVRFAARLGFNVEAATADAIRQHASAIVRISPERVADELRRMLTPATRSEAWLLIDHLDLYEHLFRTLTAIPSNFGFIRSSTLPDQISFSLALAVCACDTPRLDLLDATEKQIAEVVLELRRLFKLSNEDRDSVKAILTDASAFLQSDLSLARRMRFMAKDSASDTRRLLVVLESMLADDGRTAQVEPLLRSLESVDCAPPPFVTGDDLVVAGLSPGPRFKKVLDDVYDAQLEGRVTDRTAAMVLALDVANQMK